MKYLSPTLDPDDLRMSHNVWSKFAVPQAEGSIRRDELEGGTLLLRIAFNTNVTAMYEPRSDPPHPQFTQLCSSVTVTSFSSPMLGGRFT